MDRLSDLLHSGADKCVRRLSRISRKDWSLRDVTLSDGGDDFHETLLSDVKENHYGSFLSAPGVSFLVIFQRSGGFVLSDSFTDAIHEATEFLEKKDFWTLMEVSNILVNALLTPIASACGKSLIVSSPEMKIDNRRGLLTWALHMLKDPKNTSSAAHIRMELPQHKSHCAVILFFDDALHRRLQA